MWRTSFVRYWPFSHAKATKLISAHTQGACGANMLRRIFIDSALCHDRKAIEVLSTVAAKGTDKTQATTILLRYSSPNVPELEPTLVSSAQSGL